MNVVTGYGYFILNSHIIAKVELPAGTHPDPSNGAIYIEVPDQETLNSVSVYVPPPDPEIAAQAQIQANRMSYIDALIAGNASAQLTIASSQASLIAQVKTLTS